MRARLPLLALLLATLSGCGGPTETGTGGGGAGTGGSPTTSGTGGSPSSGTGGTGSGGSPTGSLEQDYCAPLAALICERMVECGCGAILPTGTLDLAGCISTYSTRCLSAYAPIADAVSAGQATIDAAAAAACIQMIAAKTPGCERPSGAIPQALCPAWFTGPAALGEPCAFPFCADGLGYCPSGTCEPRPTAGQPCGAGSICAPGLLCLQGECAAPAEEGAPCVASEACEPPLRCLDGGQCTTLSPQGASCAGTEECQLGLLCTGDVCSPGPAGSCDGLLCGFATDCAYPRSCHAKGAEGAPCDVNEECVAGLHCDLQSLKCAANPADGEPCLDGVLCADGLACDPLTTECAPLPGDGAPCAMKQDGAFYCADPLGCAPDGFCAPLPGEGDTCTIDYRCSAGLGCDFLPDGSFCVPLKAGGGACQSDRVCQPGLYCEFSTAECAPVLPAGSPCNDGNECGPAGTCMPDETASFTCAPRPAAGERCFFDCAPDLHCGDDEPLSFCAPDICKEL